MVFEAYYRKIHGRDEVMIVCLTTVDALDNCMKNVSVSENILFTFSPVFYIFV